jgi:hypothetical protein
MHFNLLQVVKFKFLKSMVLKFRVVRNVTLCFWVFIDVWKNCFTFKFKVKTSKGLALLEYED